MTTLRLPNAKACATHHPMQPSQDPVKWNKAVPLQIRRQNRKSAGLAMAGLEEWRPGQTAKRGYEKAVEDWWWL